MVSRWKRYVVGPDPQGRSAVLATEPTNVQEKAGFFWRSTLWATKESPPDNSIDEDRSVEVTTREPYPGGLLYRALEIPPDTQDVAAHRLTLSDLNQAVGQRHAPTEADLTRHPSMHRTDTLDCITCVIGEIYLITDVDEVLMRPGDTVVIRGTNHGWSNRSDAPCLLVGTMVDARQSGNIE